MRHTLDSSTLLVGFRRFYACISKRPAVCRQRSHFVPSSAADRSDLSGLGGWGGLEGAEAAQESADHYEH